MASIPGKLIGQVFSLRSQDGYNHIGVINYHFPTQHCVSLTHGGLYIQVVT